LSDDKIGNDYYISAAMTVNGKTVITSFGRWNIPTNTTIIKTSAYRRKPIPQRAVTASLLGDARKNITLNFGITGVVGYESINRGEAMLYDGAKILSEDNFIYGAGGRLTFETYLSDRFVLVLQGRTKVFGVRIYNSSDRPQVWD
jgi:hypothetical protein